jgi:2-hydroxy-4-carboxymuconate semialdehyde hemiacetal dehydrogenase
MKVCLVGEGAMGTNHMKVLQGIEGVEVVTLAGGLEDDTTEFATEWGIPHHSLDLEACLSQPGVEAVVLTSPNQIHTHHAEMALKAGKHVLVEIPMGLSLAESRRVADLESSTGLVCMVCHTLRYSPPHVDIRRRVLAGELDLHHLVWQAYFFRRVNTNMFGKPRTWTDDLLWHHVCHMVDYMYWLFDDPDMEVWGQKGPAHGELGIPMDLSIGLRTRDGCLITGAFSFNNHGAISSSCRFIGEQASYLIEKGSLLDHEGNEVRLEGNSLELQDREFFAALGEGRKPISSCAACLPAMEILDRIERSILGEAKQ